MAKSVKFKEVDDLVEGNLQRLLSNPDLAEEAFPDARIRENIIPFLRSVRKQADEGEDSDNA